MVARKVVGSYIVVVALLTIVAPIMWPWVGTVLTVALGKGLAALGVVLLLRANLISLGHAVFYAVGGYTTAYLLGASTLTDFFVLLVAVAFTSGLFGACMGSFVVRYRSIFFAMLNLALSMFLYSILVKFYYLTGGTDGLKVPAPSILGSKLEPDEARLFIYYVTLPLVVGVAYGVQRYLLSPWGKALDAIHTNELRLEYLGISAYRILLVNYVISALLAGLGGVVTAIAIGHVAPEMSYWTQSAQFVLIAVLGGVSNMWGPFVGAILFEFMRSFASGYFTYTWQMVMGAVLLLVIFYLPGGISDLLKKFIYEGRRSR